MLITPNGLSERDLAALADLERHTVGADGGRIKLEWEVLRHRAPDRKSDVLWWDGDRLLGFLGLYAFGSMTTELAGMVHPGARRRGIGRAVLGAALALCHERGSAGALLVVPRESAAGHALARGRGAVLDHSEHALVLAGDPLGRETGGPINLRQATAADLPVVTALLLSAFGYRDDTRADGLVTPTEQTLLIECQGSVVGTLRVSRRSTGEAGIYGFGVDPEHRGRGIGRAALREVCRSLRADGVQRVALEVAVDNERALTLYTSVGFAPVTTEDYYALATSAE